jgi:hypothetical protein
MGKTVSYVGLQKLEVDVNGDLFVSEIIRDGNPPETKRVELSDLHCPLVKTVDAQIIIRRDYFTPTGEPKTFLGLQKLRFTIPKGEDYRYWFLAYLPKKMGSICLSIVDIDTLNRSTQTLDFNSKFGKRIMRKIGKLKGLSYEQARYLLRNNEILGFFSDDFAEQRV